MSRRAPRNVGRNNRGATAVEFAFVLPIMLLLIMGLAELAYGSYVRSVLNGAIQKAGRDSTIQGAATQTSTIDQAVMNMVWSAAPKATYTSTRESYSQFGNIAPEPFTDTNGNGIHDTHECFSDINGNGVWDADPGASGQGGADDVAVYSITVTFPYLFPVARWLGWGGIETIQSTTILKNQPYASQTVTTVKTICP
jgi:hypothetical protein